MHALCMYILYIYIYIYFKLSDGFTYVSVTHPFFSFFFPFKSNFFIKISDYLDPSIVMGATIAL